MVYIVLMIGLLNLALGFALGLWVDYHPRRTIAPAADLPEDAPPPTAIAEQAATENEPEESFAFGPLAPQLQTAGIPDEWLDLLDGVESTNSFVEASIQVLKLEVGKYRDRLVQVESQIRQAAEPHDETVGHWAETMKSVNEEWLQRQSEAASYLQQRQGGLGEHASMGARLGEILLDQTAQIETTCGNIDQLQYGDGPGAARQKLIREMSRLLRMAHELRDRVQDSMAAVLAQEGRLDAIDKKLRLDALTNIRNRTGIEQLFGDWWSGKSDAARLLSIAVMDIDHFARINEQLGPMASDCLLAELAGLLDESMGQERNDHVVARLGGQRFLFFFADCGPRQATSTIERIRQTVHATTFECSDDDIQLTVSAGVVESRHADTTSSILERAAKTLKQAKQAGRNCTYVEEASGPTAVDPPEFKVKARVIRVTGDD